MDITLDEIAGIASNEIAKKEGSTTPKVSLSFELTRSHLLKVNKAEVKIEEYVREEIKPIITEADEPEVIKTDESEEANDSSSDDKQEEKQEEEPASETVSDEVKEEEVVEP